MLRDARVDYVARDFFRQKLTVPEINSLLKEIGSTAFDVLSTRSIPYRELQLANRTVTEDDLIALMADHPGLLKRPIIISGDTVQVGFNRSALDALIADGSGGK